MRSPLTETYHRVQGMITYVRENLSTDEYMLYLDLLVPEPEVVKPVKKARKKRAAKSAHQQSLSSAIQRVPKGRVDDDSDNDSDKCAKCGQPVDRNLHHLKTDPDYHEFVAGEQALAASGD